MSVFGLRRHPQVPEGYAAATRGIDYPVPLDNGYSIWGTLDNHYWPALYVVDLDDIERDLISVDVEGDGAEAEADWDNLRSPETYLGYARRERMGSSGSLRLNQWALIGGWTTNAENVVLDHGEGIIAYRFQARDAHSVLSRPADNPIPFRILLDGEPPGAAHSVDDDENGNGSLDQGRLYQLIRQPGWIGSVQVEVSFSERGAEAYVFIFG